MDLHLPNDASGFDAHARRFRFPRRLRVLRKSDFERAMNAGVRAVDARLTLWLAPNDLDCTRLGLTVGRKHGDAVHRNRIKRLLREAFRLSQHELPAGFDLVCAPRTGAELTLAGCMESVTRLAVRLARRCAER